MSELHRFIFAGLPVRGAIVRLTGDWQEILQRRAGNASHGAYATPVRDLLGEMLAAAVLMQSNIKFDGALVMQVYGDGPVKLAVAEVGSDLRLRATATVSGTVAQDACLGDLVNVHGLGRCAVTLDPQDKQPGQQPYQGVVSLRDESGASFMQVSAVLQHYMRQSEQLDTQLVLAANLTVAAGLLIQRLPGVGGHGPTQSDANDGDEAFNRISILAASLTREELLDLELDTVLHRLFWQEQVQRFAPQTPRFACACSRARVGKMIVGLGLIEARSILAERGDIEVACEFCALQYRFDAVDAAGLFVANLSEMTANPRIQ